MKHDGEENKIIIERRLEGDRVTFQAKVVTRISFPIGYYYAGDCDPIPNDYIASYLSNNLREFVNSCRCAEIVGSELNYMENWHKDIAEMPFGK